jgi:hypothetical protein
LLKSQRQQGIATVDIVIATVIKVICNIVIISNGILDIFFVVVNGKKVEMERN